MDKNAGKDRKKWGDFVSPEKWEPCFALLVIYEKVELHNKIQSIDIEGNLSRWSQCNVCMCL